MTGTLFRRTMALAVVFGSGILLPSLSFADRPDRADEVLEWNAVLRSALVSSRNQPPFPAPAQFRLAATVHAAVFDAVNGIERRFTPMHVPAEAPPGASPRAAAVLAAYTALHALVPAERAMYDQQLEASLRAIAADTPLERIKLGGVWGRHVAKEILAWRAADGFLPPAPAYFGSTLPGKWRPTPPAFAPGLVPSLADTLPFVIPSPLIFRPAGPPPLTSPEYAADVNEVKLMGELSSTARTADQTESARFWNATNVTFWNRAGVSAALQRNMSLSDSARLFALLNAAMADAMISCWNAKYHYEFWRPITAIRLASTDGNPDTVEQANWTPLVATPPYPEYSSGHAAISGAAQAVLTIYFGDRVPVEGTSEGLPGVVRTWPNFSAAADEANLARIWAGIHFRAACRDARADGDAIGRYVMAHAAQPVRGGLLLGP